VKFNLINLAGNDTAADPGDLVSDRSEANLGFAYRLVGYRYAPTQGTSQGVYNGDALKGEIGRYNDGQTLGSLAFSSQPSVGSTLIDTLKTLDSKFDDTYAKVPPPNAAKEYYAVIGFSGEIKNPFGIRRWEINRRDLLGVGVVCYSGDSRVVVFNENTNQEEIKLAGDIKANDVVKNNLGKYVKVAQNIICRQENSFYLLEKDSLGENIPDHDFYLTEGHPLLINGTETTVEKIPQAIQITKEIFEPIYSIVTHGREYIKINNLDVATWDNKDWEKYQKDMNFLSFSTQ
jgi:hypothetical protein